MKTKLILGETNLETELMLLKCEPYGWLCNTILWILELKESIVSLIHSQMRLTTPCLQGQQANIASSADLLVTQTEHYIIIILNPWIRQHTSRHTSYREPVAALRLLVLAVSSDPNPCDSWLTSCDRDPKLCSGLSPVWTCAMAFANLVVDYVWKEQCHKFIKNTF